MFDIAFLKGLPAQVRLTDCSIAGNAMVLERVWTGNTMRALLRNTSDAAVRVREVALMYGNFPLAASCPFYSEGFHMLSQHGGTLHEPHNIGKYGTDEKFFSLKKSPFSPDTYTAYSLMLLSPTQYDRALMAFSSCNKFMGEFRFKNNYIEIVMDCEDIELRPGETWQFEEFIALFGEKRDALFEKLAERINENHPRRKYADIPFGWCSYHSISGIKAEEMYMQARAMHTRIPELKRIQIDDGYQSYTDWLIPNPETGADMKKMCDRIRAEGCEPAGYISPFTVDVRSRLFAEHPDWLIRDKHGRKVISGIAWGGFYALDFEKEEVRTYIKAFFDRVFDEWGFDMVKLDFLYAAAIKPRNNKTRGQLMCEAMDFLRECCRDKIILGCGVPLAPAFGVVDACRISCDVENTFKEKFYVKVTNQEIISAKMAMVNSVYRRHLNGRIWANDPDVFFLRDGGMKKAGYTMQQKRLLATVNHMFGDVLFVSDDIGEYDSEKMEILLDAYKKFDGKIISAENIAPEIIKVVFEQNGKKQMLVFDDVKGDFIVQKAD